MKKKILIIIHEASCTGAPLAALRLAIMLKQSGCTVIFAIARLAHDEYLQLLRSNDFATVRDLEPARYDVVIAASAATAPIVANLLDAKNLIWWLHEDSHFFNVTPGHLIEKCLLGATHIVVQAHHIARDTLGYWLNKRVPYNVHIIQNSVPNLSENHVRGDGKFRVVHMASPLTERKGTKIVFEVAESLRDSNKDIFFEIIGPDGDPTLLGCIPPENVRMWGRLPQEQAHSVLKQAHLFIHPSRLDNQPLVILEALGFSVPVICSELKSIQEYAGPDNGVHVVPALKAGEVDAYRKIIVAMSKSPSLWRTESKMAFGLASRRFSQGVQLSKFNEVFGYVEN